MSTDHAEDDADVMQQDDAYDESHMDEEVNYDEGEPEADDDGDAYESDSEVDELVDEIDEPTSRLRRIDALGAHRYV